MPKLPILSGKDLIKKLCKLGYTVVRQKGSHVRLLPVHGSGRKPITVPLHPVIRQGLLHHILKDVNLSLDEFLLM